MAETMQQYSQAETNRLIRAELQGTYPGTVFTVRSSNGAGITQTVIGWEIHYRPTSAEFDGYYSPRDLRAGVRAERGGDRRPGGTLQLLGMGRNDGVREHAPERLVAVGAGELPRYGAGNVTAYPRYQNIDL